MTGPPRSAGPRVRRKRLYGTPRQPKSRHTPCSQSLQVRDVCVCTVRNVCVLCECVSVCVHTHSQGSSLNIRRIGNFYVHKFVGILVDADSRHGSLVGHFRCTITLPTFPPNLCTREIFAEKPSSQKLQNGFTSTRCVSAGSVEVS